MKVLFLNETLNYRGVTNSTVDYAEFNQSILGNESTILYNKGFAEQGIDLHTREEVVRKLSKKYEVLSYDGTHEHLNKIAEKYDVLYMQKGGNLTPPFVESTKFAVHCVFQYYNPHGDAYAYISEWLSKEAVRTYNLEKEPPFVPYIVDMPPPDNRGGSYLRTRLGIPKNKFVYGRHGGVSTFDLKFVAQAVANAVQKNNDLVFIFVNTPRFFNHPNIYYLDPFFGNQEKSNFISACDAMIHGRRLGESFGNSVAEFLFHDKPVLAWEGGFDKNHVNWLQPYNLLYNDKNVEQMILDLPSRPKQNYKSIVESYNPNDVMQKFKEIFL